MAPRLRDAVPDDVPALLELEMLCYPEEEAFGPLEYDHAVHAKGAVNLVLEDEGRIAGFVGAFRTPRRRGHVYTLNVHPDVRGRGHGRRLLHGVEARLRDAGVGRVHLEVNVANANAIRLYESMGYVRVKRLPGYYALSRVPDGYRYEKVLS